MSKPKYRDPDWLETKLENKSQKRIAENIGVTTACINKWKRKHKIGQEERVKCPSCNGKYKKLALHWHYNPSHRPGITPKQEDIITGILMGDGTMNREEDKNPRLQVYMTNREYLSYIDGIFGILSTGVYHHLTPEESAKNAGLLNVNPKNCKDVYGWQTRRDPRLQKFASWYSAGTKSFPKDIVLTPTVLKHWYVCDGTFDKSNRSIKISCCNEYGKEDKLEKIFSKVDIDVGNFSKMKTSERERLSIQFHSEESEKIFDYIGEPLPGFEYKWP
jgi:hypothetical protein